MPKDDDRDDDDSPQEPAESHEDETINDPLTRTDVEAPQAPFGNRSD